MPTKYMKVGVDHGTTNSAIAVMEDAGARIVMPDGVNDVMPSVVFINRYGAMSVGAPAYAAMLTLEPGQGTGHGNYKMNIGQDCPYSFDEAKKVLKGPELGGIVLGELIKRCETEINEKIVAAVITIPAVWPQSNSDGTKEAAKLAGIQHCVFLPEPIAAATAYGFNKMGVDAQWIVFDLGGGTLDVSLVFARSGDLSIPEKGNAGERLGGGKWDRDLMDYVLTELKKTYSLDGFKENDPVYKSAWGKLLLATEQAKIRLSKEQTINIHVENLCKDKKGKTVEVDVPITREKYEQIIAPDVERCIRICQHLINANQLKTKEIDGIILVGGPTKTPYLQKLLGERLGIHLIKDIDPMTAVALGAATYARTVEYEDKDSATKEKQDITIRLSYPRQSRDPRCTVWGEVTSETHPLNALFVEM
ncbi:MAG: Hsp70 family protein, partial [bacterium]